MNAEMMDRIREVLIHNVGDTRKCPKCHFEFVPRDVTADTAHHLYDDLFIPHPCEVNEPLVCKDIYGKFVTVNARDIFSDPKCTLLGLTLNEIVAMKAEHDSRQPMFTYNGDGTFKEVNIRPWKLLKINSRPHITPLPVMTEGEQVVNRFWKKLNEIIDVINGGGIS